MVKHRIKVPPVSEGVETVIVVEWHAAAGDQVAADVDLVSVEVDKVDMVIPTSVAGTLVEILAKPGDELAIGDPLCIVEAG